MVRGTRPARSAARARAQELGGSHYAFAHSCSPGLHQRPTTPADVANGTDDERVRSPRSGTASSVRVVRHRPALFQAARPSPPTILVSAALPACAGVAAGAIWSARTMTPAPTRPAPTRPAPTRPAPTPDSRCCRGRTSDCRVRSRGGPHRPTRSCEAPDARRALGGGCEGLPELSECHGRACRAVLSGFDTLELRCVVKFEGSRGFM